MMKKNILSLLLPLALLGGCAIQQQASAPALSPEEQQRLRTASAEVLFWPEEQRDANFRRMHELFPANPVPASNTPRPLPAGASLEPALGSAEVDRFVQSQNIAGFIVLQDGKVRLERYARGFGAEQRWTSFSVAKSLTSTLVGAAIQDGHINALDDPVVRYVPELAGSAYDGVSLSQLLTMRSGVQWNEDYTNPKSDIALMFATEPPPGMDMNIAYLRNLPRAGEPGTRWNYNTAETNLIGIIVGRAVRRPLAQYLSEKIWRPYGMEMDAYWQVDEHGREVAGCCISASLRDYARVGQFMLDGGRAGGRQVVPEGWIANATAVNVWTAPGRGYGYQWWTTPQGYSAIGIFGQSIYVDPKRRIVMVTSSAWPSATSRDLSMAREGFFRAIREAVDAEAR
jgi:CubicO group peptidase (beta-lactamase class C family)